jgi:hypothetical protein
VTHSQKGKKQPIEPYNMKIQNLKNKLLIMSKHISAEKSKELNGNNRKTHHVTRKNLLNRLRVDWISHKKLLVNLNRAQ